MSEAKITAAQVFEILPEFKSKLDDMLKNSRDENQWADYEQAKSFMAQHVGFLASEPRAKSADAYDAVLDYICERLNI